MQEIQITKDTVEKYNLSIDSGIFELLKEELNFKEVNVVDSLPSDMDQYWISGATGTAFSTTITPMLYIDGLMRELIRQIHIIQTPACHPMVKSPIPISSSLATAIVDNVGFRKESVRKGVLESGGSGWIAINKDISEAKILVKKTENIDVSSSSALSIAGLVQAIEKKWPFEGPVVCLLTGR